MKTLEFEIGQEVVRTKGDYVVGRVGNVVGIDSDLFRAQISWNGETKTWVSFSALALTSIPYKIEPGKRNEKTGRFSYPKYRRI